MKHIAWDYEESTTEYYHIYSVSEEGERMLEGSLTLVVPQTKENDDIVDEIVNDLEKLLEQIPDK